MLDEYLLPRGTMLKLIVDLVVLLTGAAAGAGFGTWFALRKLRKETAFERGLRWCESVLKTLNEAGASLMSTREVEEGTPVADDCWRETIRLYQELIPLCGQKELYASTEGIRGINGFM